MTVRVATFAWIGFVPLGFAILWASNLFYAGARNRGETTIPVFLSLTGGLLVFAGLVGPMLFLGSLATVAMLPLIMAMLLMAIAQFRERESRALTAQIDRARGMGIPVEGVAKAYARQANHEVGRRAARLAVALARGMSLTDAFRSAGLHQSTDVRWALHLAKGETSGTGERTPRTLLDTQHDTWWLGAYPWLFQVAVTWFAAQFVLLWTWQTILPPMRDVAFEMGSDVAVKSATFGVLEDPWLSRAALLGTCGVWLVMAIVSLYYMGWVRWEPPGIRRFVRPLHEARLLQSLCIDVCEQRSMLANIADFSRDYPAGHIRRRLARALGDLNNGRDWVDALNGRGLISKRSAELLRAGQRAGNPRWALQTAADQVTQWWQLRMNAIWRITLPCLVLLVALPVLLLGYCTFSWLSTLTEALS